jgi:hypothetical protein
LKACICIGSSIVQGDFVASAHRGEGSEAVSFAIISENGRGHVGRLIPSIRKNQSSAAAETPSAKSDISGGNHV